LHGLSVKCRGLSLLEAIIALFLLSGSLLVLLALFQSALNDTGRAATRQTAVVVAEKTLDGLRAQASQSPGYDSWSSSPPLTTATADADYPLYKVQAQWNPAKLYSPCSSTELGAYPTDPRVLTSSAYKVKLTVSWSATDSVAVTTLIGDPVRSLATNSTSNPFPTLHVSPVGSLANPLARNAVQQFSVTATDGAGNPVHDLLVDWYVATSTGNAVLSQDRRGTMVNATNGILLPSQPTLYTGGAVTVMARARLWGYEQAGISAPMQLTP
jgi:Tfp pilus assembly protein PilV